ncbi:MAG TPA: rhodanese-like domain-containing protein [Candidatus Binatia bacterium]|jgi:rhodanese-related sulfurtransferase
MQVIGLDELRGLTANGAILVEVLPKKEYERAHLPRAISLPLTDLYPFSANALTKDRLTVVYCYDSQ